MHLKRARILRSIKTDSARCALVLFGALTLGQLAGCSSQTCFNPPTITGKSADLTVAAGEPAIFTVAAIGSGIVSYQWSRSGKAISGATQATYITPPTTPTDSGSSFTVLVSNSLGQVASDAAMLTVVQPGSNEIRFVSPMGSDSNVGTLDQPYRTIQRCASTVAQGGICKIRAGTYRETVTPNSDITITAYQAEQVIVDGSDPITQWTLDHGAVYKTNIALHSDDTNQLFVGQQMMTEARWPNGNDLFAVNWATEQKGTDTTHIVDSNLPGVNWAGAKVHLWSGSDPFSHETGTVTTSGRGQIGINVDQTGTCPYICPTPGGYYYLFGTLAALDVEQEWFYDAPSTTLYFMAPGGANPNQIDVRGKQRQYAFDLRGRHGVTISNIAIFASTVITDTMSVNNTLDRISATYVSHFTNLPKAADDPDGKEFSILQVHRDDTGLIIEGTGNIVRNSTVSFSAGAGIALNGSDNVLMNNLIQNIDYIGAYPAGIDLNGQQNVVEHNTISQVGRQGIYVLGVDSQDIGFNNIFDGMLLSRDGGEIYACCNQVANGTRIHHNWLHDTQPVISGQGDSSALSGIVFDNGSSGFSLDQNVLWKNKFYNILINGVSGNTPDMSQVRNNTIPDNSSDGQIGIIYVPVCSSTVIEGNRIGVDIKQDSNGTACLLSNNQSIASGASEMTTTTQVGCNFSGCASNRPPKISDQGDVSACPALVP